MRNMIAADLHAGNAFTVVDPHGTLIDDILEAIPRRRTNVVYIDPAHPSRVTRLGASCSDAPIFGRPFPAVPRFIPTVSFCCFIISPMWCVTYKT